LLKICVFQDPGCPSEKDKPNRRAAISANREHLSLEDSHRVILTVEMVPNGVHARFWRFISRFEYLFRLRCALH